MATSTPSTSTAADPALTDFIERYESAWNTYDDKAMADLLADDIVWYDPALPEPARGIQAVQQFMRDSWRAFPDMQFSEPDPPHLTANGDLVSWAWRMQGTNKGPIDPPGFAATGKAVDIKGVDLWRMRDGRIAHYQGFYDLNELVTQLGIVPAPGSRGERGMVAMQKLGARFKRGR
jgi:steroid delta-isomerase-like uncharacterized protein